MIKSLLMIIVALCCLAWPAESRAQDIYTYSNIQFYPDDPTRILGSGTMQMDYSSQVYYTMRLEVSIWSTGASPETFDLQVREMFDVTWQHCYAWVDYDPAAEYDTKMNPIVYTSFRSDDGVFYRDYYNYAVYEDGLPVMWPGAAGAYGFAGTGPENNTSFSQVLLGSLFAIFSAGSAHGTPHHVKVASDETTEASCGVKDRMFKLQVVDSAGRRAGVVQVREQLLDAQYGTPVSTVYNSCQDDHFRPRGCTPTDFGFGGQFTDRLWVGCPINSPNCGFSPILSRWLWCPRDRPEVTLTTNRYEVNSNSILINDVPEYTPGTRLY
jgi:hypothetical protein